MKLKYMGEALKAVGLRQPVLPIMAVFLSGICLGFAVPDPDALCLCVSVAFCVSAFLLRVSAWRSGSWQRADTILILLALFLCGMGRTLWELKGRTQEADRIRRHVGQTASCVGHVGPEVSVKQRGERTRCHTFAFEQVEIRWGETLFPVHHLPMKVSWYGGAQEMHEAPLPGEAWRLSGRVKIGKGRNGLLAMTLNSGQGEKRSARLSAVSEGTWMARLMRARREAVRRVSLGIESWGEIPALNQAMLLGCRNEMPAHMRRVFADSGTIHVFAISGLHIVLVAELLILMVRMTGLRRSHWGMIVIPLLIAYTVITGACPSAVRACVMAVLFFLAPFVGRRPNGLSALAATAVMLHACQPDLVFDIGNVLSFVVMGGLVVFCAPFSSILRRLLGYYTIEERTKMLSAAGEKERSRRWHQGGVAVKYFADSLAVSVAAWLASVPLTAYYFGRFTIGGLLANLIVVPCSFFVVVAGFLGFLVSFVNTWVAVCFNHAAGFFTQMMIVVAQVTASIPGLNCRIPKWAGWQVIVWFAGLGIFSLWLHTRQERDRGMDWMQERS